MDGKGFTLLELVMAMAVIVIALAALLAVITATTKLHVNTEREVTAKNEARRIMETVKSYTCAEIVANYGAQTDVEVDTLGVLDSATATVIVDSTNPDMLDIRIRIRWKTGEFQGKDRFETYEVRRLISDGS